MSAVFELSENEALFEREKQRFLASLARARRRGPGAEPPAGPHASRPRRRRTTRLRQHARHRPVAAGQPRLGPSHPGPGRDVDARRRRRRRRHARRRRRASTSVIASAVEQGEAWGALSGAERARRSCTAPATCSRPAAPSCSRSWPPRPARPSTRATPRSPRRSTSPTTTPSRPRELDDVDGATFVPAELTVVTPPWNFPVAIPAGSTLAALAAGSAVVIKPASQARRSGAVHGRGALGGRRAPRRAADWSSCGERELGRAADLRTRGGPASSSPARYETAELFRSFRQDLPLLAETSGKNAIIVTPSADLDLAAKDVVVLRLRPRRPEVLGRLAGDPRRLGGARPSASATSSIDAVTSLEGRLPDGPDQPDGPDHRARQRQAPAAPSPPSRPGENWARRAAGSSTTTGRLWSPGRQATASRRGSDFHLTEYFGPVLGIMTADDARARPSRSRTRSTYGLTAGHALARRATSSGIWLDTRPGRQPLRQPRHHRRDRAAPALRRLEEVRRRRRHQGRRAQLPGRPQRMGAKPSTAAGTPAPLPPTPVSAGSRTRPRASWPPTSSRRCSARWPPTPAPGPRNSAPRRTSPGLSAERNVFRYRALPVTVRLSEGEPLARLVRTVAAGVLAGSDLTVSTAVELPAQLRAVLSGLGIAATVENDADWLASAGRLAAAGRLAGARIRLIGGDAKALAEATGGRPDLAVYFHPVTEAGRVGAAAVPARAGRQHHGAPLRHAQPHLGRPDLGQPTLPALLGADT